MSSEPLGKRADRSGPAGRHSGARSSWEPPRVLFREPLEAVAVACVPAVPDGPGKPDTIQCASPQS